MDPHKQKGRPHDLPGQLGWRRHQLRYEGMVSFIICHSLSPGATSLPVRVQKQAKLVEKIMDAQHNTYRESHGVNPAPTLTPSFSPAGQTLPHVRSDAERAKVSLI
jgi:hypothetical protein